MSSICGRSPGPEWGKATEDPNGRPHYAFDLLLKVWLYGYLYNIRSSRKLERACRQMMPLVWLAGMHEPDHNTLWRFWTRYRKALKKVFVNSVRVAVEANLVGMVVQAVDGTKIVSACLTEDGLASRGLWPRSWQQWARQIEKLEQEIAAAKEGGAEIDDRLPQKLQDETQLRASSQRSTAGAPESRSGAHAPSRSRCPDDEGWDGKGEPSSPTTRRQYATPVTGSWWPRRWSRMKTTSSNWGR